MFKDITIGQYIKRDSQIHSINPGVKLIIFFLLMFSVFTASQSMDYVILILFFLLVQLFSKLPLMFVLKGVRPLMFLILLTFFLQLFFSGNMVVEPSAKIQVLFNIGPFTATFQGLTKGLQIVFRLVILVLFTSLLTLTTTPISLTFGIEKVFGPLKKIRVPVHEFALMMTIALRFIPTLIIETDKIMKAQKSRGADFESGSIIQRMKNFMPLLIPLFLNSFKRAEELAQAMEVKCYTGGQGRTRMKNYPLELRDFIALAIGIGLVTAVIMI